MKGKINANNMTRQTFAVWVPISYIAVAHTCTVGTILPEELVNTYNVGLNEGEATIPWTGILG